MRTLSLLRGSLAAPRVYVLFQRVVWGRAMQALVADHIRPEPGMRVLDMGCGPADILRLMPDVRYVGFDHDEPYVESARRRFAARESGSAEFVLAAVGSVPPFDPASFDVVLAKGLLHHITDDEARRLFRLAHDALRPGGRLITVDGCFHDRQPTLHRLVTGTDRGEHIRIPRQYRQLGEQVFDRGKVDVFDRLLRIPYSLAIGTFTR